MGYIRTCISVLLKDVLQYRNHFIACLFSDNSYKYECFMVNSNSHRKTTTGPKKTVFDPEYSVIHSVHVSETVLHEPWMYYPSADDFKRLHPKHDTRYSILGKFLVRFT